MFFTKIYNTEQILKNRIKRLKTSQQVTINKEEIETMKNTRELEKTGFHNFIESFAEQLAVHETPSQK